MPGHLIGSHASIQELKSVLLRYAAQDFPVLLHGESGTGKEIAARDYLHASGPRANKPWVAINCAAFNAELIEASLFGHTRGAFTGAYQDEPGSFACTGDGTLFLDEIGELPLSLQGKLLRVLESGEYQQLGQSKIRHSKARIIAATNRNLPEAVTRGHFRADLYHRLSVLNVHIPPLRERGEDRFTLFDHFRAEIAAAQGNPAITLDPSAQRLWQSHPFPGNVRELKNIVVRLSTCYPGERIDQTRLARELIETPRQASTPPSESAHIQSWAEQMLAENLQLDVDSLLNRWQHALIVAALKTSGGNVSQAARRLKLGRTTLYHRLSAWDPPCNP